MSTDFFQKIQQVVATKFSETCEVEILDDSDARFSWAVRFADFVLVVIGSEARVCVKIIFTECEPDIKQVLLAAICNDESGTKEQLSPYIMSVWRNEKRNYLKVPSVGTLLEEESSFCEICTRPCDISTSSKVELEVSAILLKTIEWIMSYKYDDHEGAMEGAKRNYSQTRTERSKANRKRCIFIYGLECQICNEKLSDKYGDLAEGFIHVHHIEGLAKGGTRWIDPRKDLIPVCPNCHSILHSKEPPLLPSELRQVMASKAMENR